MKKKLIGLSWRGWILLISSLVFGNNFDDFMKELNEAPGVIVAHREAATLWVKVSGTSDFKEREQELVEKIADWYQAKFGGGRLFCFESSLERFYGSDRKWLSIWK